ncbi:hypothetical protein GC176_12650 [bacterium]|nr:hypothetical protein [bacterium]
MTSVFALMSAEDLLVELLVAGALGHGLCHVTQRMKRLQPCLFRASAWLGGITGLLIAFSPSVSGDFTLAGVALTGLFTGALATCGWYLAVAVLAFVWQHVVTTPFRWLGRLNAARVRRRNQCNTSRAAVWNENQQADHLREQEQAKRDSERRQRDEQKRRDDSRFDCQMHYDRLAASLRDQFSPARLQEYFDRYMSDGSSADEVEDRAAKLRDMLDELSGGGTDRSRNGATLESVRQEFQTRRQEIQSAGFDEKTEASMLSSLAREEERAIRECGQS